MDVPALLIAKESVVNQGAWPAMKVVRPDVYVRKSESANEAQVTLYDLGPDRSARLQIVAAIRLDGAPLGFVFTREKRIKVWAHWETVIPHFQTVLRPRRRIEMILLTGELPEADAQDFCVPPAFRDRMLALGPRDAREIHGS